MEFQYGNLQNGIRQYDIPLANGRFYEIPNVADGRIMADDFVYFIIPQEMDPNKYDVLVQSLDTAGTLWRNIGTLNKTVKLPFVQFGPYAQIGVIPKNDAMLPRYSNILVRGATYQILAVGGKSGDYMMPRFGGKF